MFLLQMAFSKCISNSKKKFFFLLMNINLSFLKFNEALYTKKKKKS